MTELHAKASAPVPDWVAGTVCHELKVWPQFYQAIKRGDKAFEIRWNDRNYAAGDTIWMREWRPPIPARQGDPVQDTGEYTGEETYAMITYVMCGKDKHPIRPGFCVMSIALAEEEP